MPESVEYRWLLFKKSTKSAYFSDYYNFDNKDLLCWGLYCFPPFTIFPSYSFNQSDPTSAVSALRTWAEDVAIPMRVAMPRDLWEEQVRVAAYFIWEAEGRPDGRATEHWCEAAGQLAELLETDYVFAKFHLPEEADGGDEMGSHGDDPEPQLGPPVHGGTGGGQEPREEFDETGLADRTTFVNRIARFFEAVLPGHSPGRLVRAVPKETTA